MTANPITFGSLFSGVRGLDLGFERAGLSCSYQVEINDHASRVLAKHWPDVVRFRDVREVGKHNLPYADVIGGGFPCQGISYAGKGMGLADERSGLWHEYARIIGEMEPKVVVVENVAALLGRGIDAVLGTLASLGFDAEWHCIPASYVGAPHVRDRVFLIAYANGQRLEECDTPAVAKAAGFGSRMGDAGNVAHSNGIAGLQTNPRLSTLRKKWDARENAGCSYWASTPAPDWTVSESRVHGVADGISDRVERLSETGNAIVPQVAEYVARQFVLPRLAVAA